MIMLDASGRVTDVMIRRLSEDDQATVLERLRNPHAQPLDNSKMMKEISAAQLNAAQQKLQFLDVRPSELFRAGHRSGARNIPLNELGARCRFELDAATPIVVDCLPLSGVQCRGAAWTLVDMGFSGVSILIR
jgi:rhodanese-related sulfurtransferase